jgi:hypothetical protein
MKSLDTDEPGSKGEDTSSDRSSTGNASTPKIKIHKVYTIHVEK